ncbi:aspartic peptidase domain-containing protein [Lineolata rhizophorae]|uniref:Aspartic peptidase domain-containing protein n=1 Tax=Lineolata rhizophorae TaxID=578093 RepID=A0A6A6P3N3_9PEZI|nr:aspartic peptidase domain-containing protein [Lineolata rhizophorae]
MATLQRITRIPNPKYQKSGIKSYVWLMRKYNFAPTKDGPYFVGNRMQNRGKFGILKKLGGRTRVQHHVLQKRLDAKGQTGEVPTDDQQNDVMYLSEVTIGTPPQKMSLDFDTGSADLWVWSTELPQNVQEQGKSSGHNMFDPKASSSFKAMPDASWQIQYGDQSSASGTVGTDTLHLGGIDVENQAIELASDVSQQFLRSEGDGLLGLAFGTINTVQPQQVNTPVENMIAQGDIPKEKELFTAYLGSWRDANEPDEGVSFYTFGYVDQAVTSKIGEPKYTPIDDSNGWWQFPSTTAEVAGKTVQRPAGNTAIADTGTTLALVDDDFCQAIYDAIPGATYDYGNQGYVFPVDTPAEKLPVVKVAVGDNAFEIQKEDLGFADAGNGMVYGGIQSRGDMDMDILGGTFLKAVYAVFDQGNKRFGAVQRQETEQNLDPPQ